MLKDYNSFNEFEQAELNNIGEAIKKVKAPMENDLNNKLKALSTVNNSIDQINSVANNDYGFDNSINNSSSNANKGPVRTLGARNPNNPYTHMSASNNVNTNNSPVSNYGYVDGGNFGYSENDSFASKAGYTQAFLLVSTGLLVLLVFVVSFSVFNFLR